MQRPPGAIGYTRQGAQLAQHVVVRELDALGGAGGPEL